jgi:hypothetical protein
MANHALFYGGLSTSNPRLRLFPQRPPLALDFMEADNRRGGTRRAITRLLDFCATTNCAHGCGDAGDQSRALQEYLTDAAAPINAGDTIDIAIISKFSTLERVWWNIETPITPFTFNFNLVPVADGVNAPVVVAAGPISGTAVASALIVPATPIYTDENMMLRMTVVTAPAAAPVGDNRACGGSKLTGLRMFVTPVVEEYLRGAW